MKAITYILTITALLLLTSCDPVHSLTLENRTKSKIEVLYYPALELGQAGNKSIEKIEVLGHKMNKLILNSDETITIGTTVASYTPSAKDIELDYLEIRYGQDTIRLTGKNAILTAIQEVEQLDWRIIVK